MEILPLYLAFLTPPPSKSFTSVTDWTYYQIKTFPYFNILTRTNMYRGDNTPLKGSQIYTEMSYKLKFHL